MRNGVAKPPGLDGFDVSNARGKGTQRLINPTDECRNLVLTRILTYRLPQYFFTSIPHNALINERL